MKTLFASLMLLPLAVLPVKAADGKNIVETAVAAGDFSTLAAALQAAELVETLSGPGPFTVFAPTDAAFAALPAGALDNLLKPENKAQLVEVLTFHVVPGAVASGDIQTGEVTTVSGKPLNVVKGSDGVTVNGVKVIAADVDASNGVIHVIEGVLLP